MSDVIAAGGRRPLVIVSSSSRVSENSDYGRSKLACEQTLLKLEDQNAATVAIYRLPSVFGKWAKPDYNSVVATFCHNLARGLPIRIDDPAAPLSLLYVDDLIDQWCALMADPPVRSGFIEPRQVHRTTVGELASSLREFAESRSLGRVGEVGVGLHRALYATYISALPTEAFSYPLIAHTDPRGAFTEVLKTPASGQFSYFTSYPGVTRGGHYHHSKVEKFLIVEGQALFRFRHILSGETHELQTSGDQPVIVETIPGWTHDVTNIGEGPMISLLWANEVFDRYRPDTVAMPV
jgi:UDP-2-acetamido-2,6-beta-L-arabino-hexul-4-ose reductase